MRAYYLNATLMKKWIDNVSVFTVYFRYVRLGLKPFNMKSNSWTPNPQTKAHLKQNRPFDIRFTAPFVPQKYLPF